MGWTSKPYRKTDHFGFNNALALEFLNDEFYGYGITNAHFNKANDEYEHHELYCSSINAQGEDFLFVVIVDIKDDEIYWKEIDETMGPAYYNCPIDLIDKMPILKDETTWAYQWRETCKSQNVKPNYIIKNESDD